MTIRISSDFLYGIVVVPAGVIFYYNPLAAAGWGGFILALGWYIKRKLAAAMDNYMMFKDADFDEVGEEDRRRLYECQDMEAEDWGYSVDNPIVTASTEISNVLLKMLGTPDGDRLESQHAGILKSNKKILCNYTINAYNLLLNGNVYKTIYLCPYGLNPKNVPKGLIAIDQEEDGAKEDED